MDPFQLMLAGTGQNGLIGNKFDVSKISINGLIKTHDDQATYDEWIGRISVLQLKNDVFANGVLNATALIKSLQMPVSNTSSAGDSWYTCPWDYNKCRVLSERKWHRHAAPETVQIQANCHFKAVPFRLKLKWPRGKTFTFNPITSVTGSNLFLTKVLNPIIIVFQSGALIQGGTFPAGEALPAFFSLNAGDFYITYRDS